MSGSAIPLMKIDNLQIGYSSVSRKGKMILYGPLSLEVSRPELIGIIGRNGIGKSTLLRTIAGIQSPMEGKIYLQGNEIQHISKSTLARLISFVSTDPVRIQGLKVKELVAMGRFPYTNWFGKLTGVDRDIIRKANEQTGITRLLDKSVYQLSDGERQKVMIARALVQDTPVIVLDEPTAFLDLPARHEMLRLLYNLSRSDRKLVLFTTHDLSIAMDEVDKLWLMTDEGIFEGAPEDLLINQVFRKLFLNTAIDFDINSMAFKFKKKYSKSIIIHAQEPYFSITRVAMERIGIQTTTGNNPDFTLEIQLTPPGPVFVLNGKKSQQIFHSLYEMAFYLTHLV